MIYDSIKNIKKYTIIPHLNDIVSFIESNDVKNLAMGDVMIKGNDLYVKVLKYKPQDASKNYFETHNNYIDVQIVFTGIEMMQVVQSKHLIKTDEFKLDGDFEFFKATEKISDIIVADNEFAVFFPGEAHKPGCRYNNIDNEVIKLVFKVKKIL